MTTVLLLFMILWIAAGLTGTVLFTLSVCVGRTAALFVGSFLAVLSVVFANLYLWQAWIGFLSPFSWLDLLLLYGKVSRPAPTFAVACGEVFHGDAPAAGDRAGDYGRSGLPDFGRAF